MIRIIIADDHAVVCTGIRLILDATGMFCLEDQVPNGDELLVKLAANRNCYDIALLDISMPGMDAFDVIGEVKSRYPDLSVVIFTMNPEAPYALRFFKQGASAFIRKDSQPEEIIRILKIVANGKKYYSTYQIELMANLIQEPSARQKGNYFEGLTDRELQVMHLLATGELKGEIARKLSVSKHTISNHRNNILKKLNLRNNSELTRYAMQNGLIS